MKKIISLCSGSGSWEKPYLESGDYEVVAVTLPDNDIRTYELPEGEIYGILAAPPCTMFSLARTRAKKPRDLNEGMELVERCMQLIWQARKRNKLGFWALENPLGYLRQFLGKPPFTYDPWEFGDPWTKKTDIWGYYNAPKKKYSDMDQVMTQEQKDRCKVNNRKLPSISDMTGSKQAAKRAITPEGFAQAFYKANR